MTDTQYEDLSGGKGEMTSAIKPGSDNYGKGPEQGNMKHSS